LNWDQGQYTGSGGDAYFCMGFHWDRFGFCRCADGIGDDPGSAANGNGDGIAGPIEVIVRPGGEIRNPEQQLEDQDLRGEEARGKRRHDAGEDGDSGREKAQGGRCV